MLPPQKFANDLRWQRRRDRPRPSHPMRVRRWQVVIALLSALARSHDPPHSSSNCSFAPRSQPHGTPLICCTDLLPQPHTPTPTNTPLGDGTSLNWMPLRAASASRPARDATQCSAVRRPHKTALKVHSMFTQSNQSNQAQSNMPRNALEPCPKPLSHHPPCLLALSFAVIASVRSKVVEQVPPCCLSCHTRLGPWNALALGTPWHTIPYHTIPYRTTPHHTIPCHTTPYHTIPHHTFQFLSIPIPFHPTPS